MNRLPALFRNPVPRDTRRMASNRIAEFSQNEPQFAYSQFTPEHYEPGYDYPLVIWLHSDASSEGELGEVMPALSARNYAAISPRGCHASRKKGGYFEWSLSESALALAEEKVLESIDFMRDRLSIHPQRIFLAGYGKGGTLAQILGLQNPQKFAGVVSINGPFPTIPRLLSQWKEAKSLPILWMHGNQSRQCSMDAMCDMLRMAFTSALSIHPIQFHCGDELMTDMLAKANRFMMQIVTNQPIELHESAIASIPDEEF